MRKRNHAHIVMGESKNYKGQDNAVMKNISELKEKIENQLQKPVILEPEFMTSHQCRAISGQNRIARCICSSTNITKLFGSAETN
jgi:RNase H-fold protein (predicted Holliday junction resolvase)